MSADNQRRHPRIKLQIEVELNLPGEESLTLTSGNLSDSGIYLQADGDSLPLVGNEVYLRLKQALGDGEAPLVKARVVRVDRGGLGLKFETDADD